jgi:hypothetical protein
MIDPVIRESRVSLGKFWVAVSLCACMKVWGHAYQFAISFKVAPRCRGETGMHSDSSWPGVIQISQSLISCAAAQMLPSAPL